MPDVPPAGNVPAAVVSPRRISRAGPVAGLLVLAPWVGEYLLGNIPLDVLVALPFLVPLYGGGALLIREAARQSGHGYPAMLLLGIAYGIVEAGLVDQSLFNSGFDGIQDTGVAYVPVAGLSAYNALSFVAGHAIWSIAVPIAIVELLTPTRRAAPWLGTKGLAATALLYVFGCWIIFADVRQTESFLASPSQMLAAATAASMFSVAAFLPVKRRLPPANAAVPRPLAAGASVFVLVNTFFFRPENWAGVALGASALGVAAWLLLRWSRLPGWSARHRFAVVAGTLPTYMAAGFILTALLRPASVSAWTGNVIFTLVAIGLLVVTARRIRRETATPAQ